MLNGVEAEDYGMQDVFLSGVGGTISYAKFYGNLFREIVFDTGDETKENLLIVGDSYSNAILKLLASHFHKTVLIDCRMSPVTQEKFTEYIEEYGIDKVLFLGSLFGLGNEDLALSD